MFLWDRLSLERSKILVSFWTYSERWAQSSCWLRAGRCCGRCTWRRPSAPSWRSQGAAQSPPTPSLLENTNWVIWVLGDMSSMSWMFKSHCQMVEFGISRSQSEESLDFMYIPLAKPLLMIILISSLSSLIQVTVGLKGSHGIWWWGSYTTYCGWPCVTQESEVLPPWMLHVTDVMSYVMTNFTSVTVTSPLDRFWSISGGTRTLTQPTSS